MLKHILVPLDQSEFSELAIDYAVNMLQSQPDSKITLLCVVDIPPMPYTITPEAYAMSLRSDIDEHENLKKSLKESARAYLNRIAARLQKKVTLLDVLVDMGDAAEMILETAKDLHVDALVMSTHGRSGISRWVFGSVTQKVLNHPPCPVFVVPGKMQKKDKEQKSGLASASD